MWRPSLAQVQRGARYNECLKNRPSLRTLHNGNEVGSCLYVTGVTSRLGSPRPAAGEGGVKGF